MSLDVTPSSFLLMSSCSHPSVSAFSPFSLFLVWLLSTSSCPFYPSEFVLLSNQLCQMKRDHFFIAPIHSHPCSLSTWYRLCIETAPAEAGAVCVQLSKSPHTHTHALTHTCTHTHTYTTHTRTHTHAAHGRGGSSAAACADTKDILGGRISMHKLSVL